MTTDKPRLADWLTALPDLKKQGGEHVGPCPLCGGTDRFRVNQHAGLRRRNPDSLARRLWAACIDATSTPAHAYLTGRYAWAPAGVGPALPSVVGWLDAGAAPRPCTGWPGLPAGAAGALVFAWRLPGEHVQAVSMEALDAGGHSAASRWRRTIGARKGAVFAVTADQGGRGGLAVVEGEVDALALVVAGDFDEVRASGGTSGMTPAACAGATDRLTLVPDRDKEGRLSALAWRRAFRAVPIVKSRLSMTASFTRVVTSLSVCLVVSRTGVASPRAMTGVRTPFSVPSALLPRSSSGYES